MDISYRLNDITLANVLTRCAQNPRYKVVISFNNHGRIREFIESMFEHIKSGNLINTVINRDIINDEINIRFDNGSNIAIIRGIPLEYKYGSYTFHEILFDYDVNCDIIDGIQSLYHEWFDCDDTIKKKAYDYLYDFSKAMDKHGFVVKLTEYELENAIENTSDELDKFLAEFRVEKPLRHNK